MRIRVRPPRCPRLNPPIRDLSGPAPGRYRSPIRAARPSCPRPHSRHRPSRHFRCRVRTPPRGFRSRSHHAPRLRDGRPRRPPERVGRHPTRAGSPGSRSRPLQGRCHWRPPPRRAAGRARRSVTAHTLRRNSIRYGKGNVAFEIRSIFGALGAVTGPRSTIARPRRAPAHDFIDQRTDVGGLRSRGTAQRQRGQDGRRGERRCGRVFLDVHPTPRIRRQSTCW